MTADYVIHRFIPNEHDHFGVWKEWYDCENLEEAQTVLGSFKTMYPTIGFRLYRREVSMILL